MEEEDGDHAERLPELGAVVETGLPGGVWRAVLREFVLVHVAVDEAGFLVDADDAGVSTT